MTVALDEDVFAEQVEPLRGELTAHCYRMMGSVHEAEDLVQETYLRAWKAFDKFEQRSSLRTWMYRIATNTCLTALEGRGRRPMPVGLGQPASDPHASLRLDYEVTWLEPLPDAVVWGGPEVDPAVAVVDRESVRLAFVAALQHLTPAQRAVLILRDVLAWQASEVAELLEISVAAVNSSLQRARATVHRLDPESESADLDDDRAKELLADYVAAFEHYDVPRIVELLARTRSGRCRPTSAGTGGPRRSARSSAPTARRRARATRSWSRRRPTGSRRSVSTCGSPTAATPRSSCRCSPSTATGSATFASSSISGCSRSSGCPPSWNRRE